MEQTSIREFFDAYATATASLDPAFLESAYAETFMFASPGGVQSVKRDDFLRVVPKRAGLFRSAGHVATDLGSIQETRLDDMHTMVRAPWSLRFEKIPGQPVVVDAEATYVLRRDGGAWRIIFQLDHQDLVGRMQELGLLARSTT